MTGTAIASQTPELARDRLPFYDQLMADANELMSKGKVPENVRDLTRRFLATLELITRQENGEDTTCFCDAVTTIQKGSKVILRITMSDTEEFRIEIRDEKCGNYYEVTKLLDKAMKKHLAINLAGKLSFDPGLGSKRIAIRVSPDDVLIPATDRSKGQVNLVAMRTFAQRFKK